MKVVAFSDIHNQHYNLTVPNGDILICSGDATLKGTIFELESFIEWLSFKPHKYKIFVPGNHDFDCQRNPNRYLDLCKKKNISFLTNGYAYIEDYTIYGFSWTPYFYDWAFNGTDSIQEQNERLGPNLHKLLSSNNAFNTNIDIFISHGPPLGILDKNREGENCGSQVLLKLTTGNNVKNMIFGHIHESYGHTKIDNCNFYNASSLNREYKLVNSCVEFNL